MTEMEMRVAKALFRRPHPQATFDEMPPAVIDGYVELARAAILAMRKPTPEMIDAAYGDDGTDWGGAVINQAGIYVAMIDAATDKGNATPEAPPEYGSRDPVRPGPYFCAPLATLPVQGGATLETSPEQGSRQAS